MFAPDAIQDTHGFWYMATLDLEGNVKCIYRDAAYTDYLTAQMAAEEAIWYAELNHCTFHKAAHIIANS